MKKYLFIILLIILGYYSCITIEKSRQLVAKKWGFDWSQNDSIHSKRSQEFRLDRDCFPGFKELDHDYKKINVKIFNRWGEKFFESDNFSTNWICSSDDNLNFNEGSHFYSMVLKRLRSTKVDTITGHIAIYNKY